MTQQLHDTGEEYMMDVVFGGLTAVSSVDIGLYDDATNTLTDANDLSDITTEPSGAAYSRQSAAIPGDMTVQDASGDWEVDIADQTFDLSDSSTGDVDSYFVVVNFQSDDKGDGSATDHLFFTGALDQAYTLSNVSGNLTVQDAGGSLS